MAFSETTLAITPLLETTSFSDMRLIVNANSTLLKTTIEDIINTLEIDLVNKYIGVDTPINKIFSQDVVISNSIIFKDGILPSSSTIASLTQSSGVSTFSIDNLVFTTLLKSTEPGSRVESPTLVIGTDDSDIPVVGPTTDGLSNKGLYVGDLTTPIPSRLSGEVEFPKYAVIQSYTSSGGSFSPRVIELRANGTLTYTYAKLVVSRTDPQFIYVNLEFPVGYTNIGNPIWLLLHEDATNRPAPGQTFTIVINKIMDSSGTAVNYSSLPTISNSPTANGINLINGSIKTGSYKRGYINTAEWSLPDTLTTDELAISAFSTDSSVYAFRFGNINNSEDTQFRPRESSISLTKSEQSTDHSIYTITSSYNMSMIKN